MEHCFPEILITYWLPFRQAFSSSGWRYFQGFIAGLLLGYGRKTVTCIASACFFVDRSLASWERFLADAQWSLPHVTEQFITLLLSQLGHQLLYAGYYLFALDTTYVPKRKGRMLGIQRWTEKASPHDAGVTVVGHHGAIGGHPDKDGPPLCRLRCLQFQSPLHQSAHGMGNSWGEPIAPRCRF